LYYTGFWKRLKCVKFPILFTDNPKGYFEKKINKDLKTNIPNWKNDFLLYFIEWMNIYKKNGLIIPKDVESVTKNYKSDNNFFEKYVSLHLKKESESILSWGDLKSHFNNWYKENISEKILKVNEIKKYFEKKVFKIEEKVIRTETSTIRGWKGWDFIDETIE
jgi:phage/plasmid-associated DNA primase